MKVAVHQPQYIPWSGYFHKIASCDCFVYLDEVQYKHREFQNRNKIRTKDGWMWLTVPVKVKGAREQKIRDVRIDNDFGWKKEHLHSIKTWYGRAPHFKDYQDFFEKIYADKGPDFLIDLNVKIITYIMKGLKIETPVRFESEIGTDKTASERIAQLCKKTGADIYLSGSGGRDYLDEGLFAREKINLQYQEFTHPCYRQGFCQSGDEFIPYLSVIDLLFNEGPLAGGIVLGEK